MMDSEFNPLRRKIGSQMAADRALASQRIAFYMALADVLGLAGWTIARFHFSFVGDSAGDRKFVLDPTILLGFLFLILIWIGNFVIVGNSIGRTKRMTWYGIAALLLLAVPATPVAIVVIKSSWHLSNRP